jgi:hypothetical protein
MSKREVHPPGALWLAIVGPACFAAGFFGPMIFIPESNLGPIVGILFSGPAGIAASAVLWAICALLKPPARAQWLMLYAVTTIGVVWTLLYIQPDPKVRGYVFAGEVVSCDRPSEIVADTFAYWNRRIAEVHWTRPRTGWQADMRATLSAAPGVVVSVRVERRNAIMQNRRLWNRSQFAAGWTPRGEEIAFYDANRSCASYLVGDPIRGYQQSEEIRPPEVWPPRDLIEVLRASRLDDVPERWRNL